MTTSVVVWGCGMAENCTADPTSFSAGNELPLAIPVKLSQRP